MFSELVMAAIKASVALAHHWMVTDRGGEKVLAEFRNIFPQAPLFTLLLRRGEIPDWVIGPLVYTSFLQNVPFSDRIYKQLLPLHPAAFTSLKVPRGTKLVLSSDAAMVKALALPPGCQQVCYCHSPPRYLWDMAKEYEQGSRLGFMARVVFRCAAAYARKFDLKASRNVAHFIANSAFVAERIREMYGRESSVIHPPVQVSKFDSGHPASDFYLIVSQLVPYKRVDVAVRAFSMLRRKLVVIGDGSEMAYLRGIAGPTVSFLGRQSFEVVKRHFETCKAFINPQLEDFGITAVEAQAAGRPVIAYKRGGALESVINLQTGVFFEEQTPESLANAIFAFESLERNWAKLCRANAERFEADRFRAEIVGFLSSKYPDYDWNAQ